MKKILSILICSVLILSLASCSSYQDAPQASFTDETETLELEGFSLEYPAGWNPIGETDPEAVYNEPIFEATSPLEDGIICSSVILVRASSTDQKKLEKIVRVDDAPEIINKLSQGLGTTLSQRNADMLIIGGRTCLWFEASFTKEDQDYVISQTYFLHDSDVYILTVAAALGHDDENALQIPFSLRFAEE
ncbi:MAG: hypothetical protein J5822_07390 [Eubacteriaceae bacterium]|nr:hypothetical protein [Eubacteriaceae bacterium]